MARSLRLLIPSALLAALAASPAAAQSCSPDEPWRHEHTAGDSTPVVTDIEGNRSTHIDVCRDDGPAAAGIVVEVQFAGTREARPLRPGQCTGKSTKWGLVRSHAAKDSDSGGAVSGTYRVCRD